MGYSTDFSGSFKLNKPLSVEDKSFLDKLNNTRRMARDIEGYGVEGEFYVDGSNNAWNGEEGVIDHNRPPKTQPGLWCQWCPNEDGTEIEWDYGEKFYNYVEWIEYIIEWLKPRGYVLNGEVKWFGEDRDDMGIIVVENNEVTTKEGKVTYEE